MSDRYKERRNVRAYNINNLTILVNDEIKIQGLELFEAELDEDDNTVDKTADGFAQFVENPSQAGQIRITAAEAGPNTDSLYTLFDTNDQFFISAEDDAAENFKVKGTCKIMKRPPVIRGAAPDKPQWIFACTYLTIKGGSYALATLSN